MSKQEPDAQPSRGRRPHDDEVLVDEAAQIDSAARPNVLDINRERVHPSQKTDPQLLRDFFRRDKRQR